MAHEAQPIHEKAVGDATVKELLDEVDRRTRIASTNAQEAALRDDAPPDAQVRAAPREFAECRTQLEYALFRYTRGVALSRGVLNSADLETEDGAARAQANYDADHLPAAPLDEPEWLGNPTLTVKLDRQEIETVVPNEGLTLADVLRLASYEVPDVTATRTGRSSPTTSWRRWTR
jgi:hypothetical protein